MRERFGAERAAHNKTANSHPGESARRLDTHEERKLRSAAWLTPVEGIVADEEFDRWGVSLAEYLELVDVTGRILVVVQN